ncbi:MAG: STAS domain-containing protein [Pseudomonadota bacterium]
MARSEPWSQWQSGTLFIRGELDGAHSDGFRAELTALGTLPDPLVVDLSGFDIADGLAAVAAVNALRALAHGRRMVLRAAPQILAHNLYRVGDLEQGSVQLEATREDEPYG